LLVATTMRRLALLALLGAAGAARADDAVPGATFYFGAGVHGAASGAGVGWGLSLDGVIEGEQLFAGATLLVGGGGGQGLAFAGLRAGAFLTSSPTVAPYVAVGYGSFAEGALGDDALTGGALLVEAGVALLRARRLGRVSISAQLLVPTMGLPARPEPWDRVDTWVLTSLRALY
jgi:hypothetical protein